MYNFLCRLCLIVLCSTLWTPWANANSVSVATFTVNNQAAVTISPSGSSITCQVTLQRPLSNSDQAEIAFYIGDANDAGTASVNGISRFSTAGGFGSWFTSGSSEYFNVPPSIALCTFTLSSNSPGMANGTGRYLYAVLFDPNTGTRYGRSQGIPVTMSSTPPASQAPTLTSLSSNSFSAGAVITITGTNFTNASRVTFYDLPAASFTINSATQITATAPFGLGSGNITVTNASGTSNGLFYVSLSAYPPVINSTDVAYGVVGSLVTVYGYNLWVGSNTSAQARAYINGSSAQIIVANATPYSMQLVIPELSDGPTTIVVTTREGTSNAYPFIIGGPCGANIICDNQCVTYRTPPALLKGRVLYDSNNPDYHGSHGSDYEWAQWQVSYDDSNWSDIYGATEANYQPPACTRITYYRRVSTHRVYTGATSPRRPWYTSATVTITPSSPPPTPTQTTYRACAGSSFVIAFTPGVAATSSRWSLPSFDWTVNGGHGVNSSSSYDVGNVTYVTVTVPANTPAGTYEVQSASTGVCGSTGFGSIAVVVGQAPLGVVGGSSAVSGATVRTYTLNAPGASNLVWTASWDIIDGQGTETIDVYFAGIDSRGSVQVDYTDACGFATSAVLQVRNLAGGQCRVCPQLISSETSMSAAKDMALYPNPATTEVTIAAGGKEATVSFYDSHGVLRKTVSMPNSATSQISLSDLPNSLYNVRVISQGRVVMQRQLQVQH